jgi:hypothetical protein
MMKPWLSATLLGSAVALSACTTSASSTPAPTATGESSAPLPITAAAPTARQVVDDFTAAGLPVADAHDTTGHDCAEAHCTQAITTTTVVIRSFATPGQAETYGMAIPSYQIKTIVLIYPPSDISAQQRAQHEAATKRAVR